MGERIRSTRAFGELFLSGLGETFVFSVLNRSGVPHIVLPVWFDTYDYAQRAEFLNIGIFGNQTCTPEVCAEELGRALVRITGDSGEASKFRASAKRLKEICRAKGNGRELVSAIFLKELGTRN